MDTLKRFILLFIILGVVLGYVFVETSELYQGEDFPAVYLDPDGHRPEKTDLELYLDRLMRITSYFTRDLNSTGANPAIAAFMASAVLRRTLRDYWDRLPGYRDYITTLINRMSNLVSHFNHNQASLNRMGYTISGIMRDESPNTHSLGTFKNGTFKKWLLRFAPINKFIASMDQLTLRKEEYAALVDSIDDVYYITVTDSDYCLARAAANMDPPDITVMHPCKFDDRCRERMFMSPSVAYTLSHRMLNVMMYNHNRRCYHYSPEYDSRHIEMLCSQMYREAVYIARRGFFARDVFMEHVALCGQIGYQEFHRRHWFHKIANWINEEGCMQEFSNFEINRTKLVIANADSRTEVRRLQRYLDELLFKECHRHPMVVAMLALSNGVRHAAHYMDDSIIDA